MLGEAGIGLSREDENEKGGREGEERQGHIYYRGEGEKGRGGGMRGRVLRSARGDGGGGDICLY